MSFTIGDEVVHDATCSDKEIEEAQKAFIRLLHEKRRRIKRKWMEINCLANSHFLQILAMLNHVADLVKEREKLLNDTNTDQDNPIPQN